MGSSGEPKLERKTFVTSRLMDFLSRKELIAQTGHQPTEWPLVVLKELVDNALDACEEAGTAPEIEVCVNQDGISVADNGPGIPADVVESILDFSTRTSSREAYVAPDRGAQGNALKTLIAMPCVLNGESGHVTVFACGIRHEITLRVNTIRQEPEVVHAPEPDESAHLGTKVFVSWPHSAEVKTDDEFDPSLPDLSCSLVDHAKPQILQFARNFATLNPHLSLVLDWHGERYQYRATNPAWSKWRPNEPTSAHWYEIDQFERLVAAYLNADQQAGRDRSVRELIAEFRGLSGTAKQKAVSDATGLARKSLSELVSGDHVDRPALSNLLAAMKEHSKPVKPKKLGVIGEDHMREQLLLLDCAEESICYRKKEGDSDGIPWVFECGFACNESLPERDLVIGVNWSPSIVNPFRQLKSRGMSLDSVLAEQRAGEDEPVVMIVHLAIARAEYADRGKSTLVIGE